VEGSPLGATELMKSEPRFSHRRLLLRDHLLFVLLCDFPRRHVRSLPAAAELR